MRKRGFSTKASEFKIWIAKEATRSEAATAALLFRTAFLVSFLVLCCTVSSLFAATSQVTADHVGSGPVFTGGAHSPGSGPLWGFGQGAAGHGGTGEFVSGGVRAGARSPVGGGVVGASVGFAEVGADVLSAVSTFGSGVKSTGMGGGGEEGERMSGVSSPSDGSWVRSEWPAVERGVRAAAAATPSTDLGAWLGIETAVRLLRRDFGESGWPPTPRRKRDALPRSRAVDLAGGSASAGPYRVSLDSR